MPLRVKAMEEGNRGLIFDIQGFSVHDGPGSRTTVFLSGCPLRCQWCANPEGRELCRQLLFSQQKCRHGKEGCRRCEEKCPRGALRFVKEQLRRDKDLCRECNTFECVQACYPEALRLSGKWYSAEEVMQVLRRDRQFWENGGVTFSGGDPLYQKEFLLEMLRRCKGESIHTAIETAGFADAADFMEIMSFIDLAFIDIKQMDSELHRKKTGVGNEQILKNISCLAASGWSGRLILRIPIIQGYNDSDDHAKALIGFMKMNKIFEINLLPFHRMGKTKWTQLGLEYPFGQQLSGDRRRLEELQRLFLWCDIACYIGDEVIY